jgi:hypothetical protein
MPDTGWVPAPSGLIEALNVRALVRTAGSGEQRQYVVFLPSDITFVAGWSKCGQRCAPPVPWRGGYVFNPCPPGTEIQGAVAGAPTTTTPSPPTTTTSTSTSTPAP